MIELRNVVKRLGSRTILDGTSLHVPKRAVFSIVGPTGVGKAMLLRLMVGLETPDHGEIMVDGDNIVGLSQGALCRLRRRFGFLFQEAALLDHLTVGENVALPIREHLILSESEVQDLVLEKLAEVGLLGEEDKKPSQLSIGMRRRVAFARALALDPDVVFVDEPAVGLDPATASYLFNLIVKTHWEKSLTYIIVTHNVRMALDVSDEILMLFRGKIAAKGTPDQIWNDPKHLIHRFMHGTFGGPIPFR
jgi:phospholipid/cholesterol/gamma-HCH transport system ATP-binding protein